MKPAAGLIVLLWIFSPGATGAQEVNFQPGGITAFAAAWRSGEWSALDLHQVLSLEVFSGDVSGKSQVRVSWETPGAGNPDFRVDEAWVAWTRDSLRWTLGRQVVRWGVLEALGLWEEFSPPVGLPFRWGKWEAPRIASQALRAQYRPGDWGTEILLVPLSSASGAPRPQDAGGGVRLQWFGPGTDLTLEGSSVLQEGLPPALGESAPRIWTWGAEGVAVVDSWTLKAEGAFSPGKTFMSQGTLQSLWEVRGAAGVEWAQGGARILTEVRGTFLEEDTGIPLFPSSRWEAAGILSWEPEEETWELVLEGWADLTLKAWFLHPSVEARLREGLKITAGVQWAEGQEGILTLTGTGTALYSHLVWTW